MENQLLIVKFLPRYTPLGKTTKACCAVALEVPNLTAQAKEIPKKKIWELVLEQDESCIKFLLPESKFSGLALNFPNQFDSVYQSDTENRIEILSGHYPGMPDHLIQKLGDWTLKNSFDDSDQDPDWQWLEEIAMESANDTLAVFQYMRALDAFDGMENKLYTYKTLDHLTDFYRWMRLEKKVNVISNQLEYTFCIMEYLIRYPERDSEQLMAAQQEPYINTEWVTVKD